MRAELEVSLRCAVILQMAAAGQSNQRRFTIFFIFKIVKFVSWMSWCWQTLTTRTSASSAADGCYCCRMTWRQYCPAAQLRGFFLCSMEQICIYYLLQQQGSRLIFYETHLICIPLQDGQWGIAIQSGCALQTKGKCVVVPPALRRADLQHFTPHPRHGWMV